MKPQPLTTDEKQEATQKVKQEKDIRNIGIENTKEFIVHFTQWLGDRCNYFKLPEGVAHAQVIGQQTFRLVQQVLNALNRKAAITAETMTPQQQHKIEAEFKAPVGT